MEQACEDVQKLLTLQKIYRIVKHTSEIAMWASRAEIKMGVGVKYIYFLASTYLLDTS